MTNKKSLKPSGMIQEYLLYPAGVRGVSAQTLRAYTDGLCRFAVYCKAQDIGSEGALKSPQITSADKKMKPYKGNTMTRKNSRLPQIRSTTVLAVRRDGKVAMAGDGQVTVGDTVMKHNARKVRRLMDGKVLCGFAGATADAFTLFDRFEAKLKEYSGDLARAAVELAKDWRTDRALRRLEAMLLVADIHKTLLISGTGDVIEPAENALAIGSGGNYAYAAALAYLEGSSFSAPEIAEKSLKIAGNICIYTNGQIVLEELN